MQVSITSDISTAWQVPFSSSELAAALRQMWRAFSAEESAACPAEALPEPALELALLDEAEMARLNEENLGCAGPTNILAFPASPMFPTDQADSARELGLLALSPRTLRREAGLYGQDLPAYTLRLLAHGLAHLLGYEHGEAMDAAAGRAAKRAAQADHSEFTRPGHV